MKALTTPDEQGRLEALHSYAVLDTAPEQAFDEITAIVAELCGTPIALISFVDEHRQWFKSRFGLHATETPRSIAFCAHALEEANGLLEVPDARLDTRFVDNPLVTGDPGIRFYAGTPLVNADGHALGTLCVIDLQPRQLSRAQRKLLRVLGRQVVRELELRRLTRQLMTDAAERARVLDEERDSRHALQIKTSLLEGIMETSPTAITQLDLDGRITYANPRAEILLGLTRDELCARFYNSPRWQSTAPDGGPWPDEQQPFRRVLESGQPVYGVEHAIEWPDGRRRQLSVSGAPIRDAGGGISSLVFSVADVTERHVADTCRRQLEAQLNHAQKMDAIGTLAGGIAHDFNNILSTILGNVVLAMQDLEGTHSAVGKLREIERASFRAKALIEKILAFSRKTPRAPRRQTIGPIIGETLGMLRAIIPAGVAIETRLCEDSLEVVADSTELSQVLINLCTNAWQSMEREGGRIVIGLQSVSTSTAGRAETREAHLWVSDNGRGMDSAVSARLFEPFFTTRAREGGTGLGLSVVHGIVTAHGGTIGVDSRPGAGTTLNIRLPLAVPDADAAPPSASGRTAAQAQRCLTTAPLAHVLYLDDEAGMVSLMTQLLERRGYRVSGFTCANSALATVALAPALFDVVVSDYNMPGATGLDVARQIAAFWPDLKVIITSGYIDDRLSADADKVGVRHVIYKPDSILGLGDAIDRVIRDDVLAQERPRPPRLSS